MARPSIARLLCLAPLLALSTLPSISLATPYLESCGTDVSGLVVMEHWDLNGSPYCITGDTQVSLLTIDPGVRVLVDGPYQIDVLASLTAIGTADSPIIFTAKSQSPLVRWRGIRFQNTAPGSTMSHCIVEYSASSGIRVVNSVPAIDHCIVRNNVADGMPGNTSEGGGVNVSLASGTLLLAACEIADNSATSHGGGLSGITTGTGLVSLANCLITRNVANYPDLRGDWVGGGLRLDGASLLMDCIITDNIAKGCESATNAATWTRGGGLYTAAGTCALERCLIKNNTCASRLGCGGIFNSAHARGAGAYQASGILQAKNCVIGCNYTTANNLKQGAGIYVASGIAQVVNCTLARNNTEGLHAEPGATVDVRNSILYFNNTDLMQVAGAPSFSYCNVQNMGPSGSNIDVNPVFAGVACDDLKIVLGSPCIDAGDPAPEYNDSCFPRSLGTGRNDIGAHGGPLGCGWMNRDILFGAPFCFGDGTQSTPCPCGNNGGEGRGCGNSNPSLAGAHLTATGTTSPNTVLFNCDGIPNNNLCTFLRSTVQSSSGAAFGDGLKCLSGTMIRFGQQISGQGGNPPHTVQTAAATVAAGNTRFYQCLYRNPNAVFCPPETFNVSNGYSIVWW